MPAPLDIAPSELRVEHLGSGILGLGVRAPRLSWRLPDQVTGQEAYQIEINGKPSPRVVSGACVLVPWPGQPVASRQDVLWRVRVWSEHGESPWSPAGSFEAGLLEESDWSAHWIELPGDDRQPLVLQKEFSLEGAPTRARLYATAHGIYECFLNGQRVGDLELTPGFTSYPTQQLVQAYDVTALLVQGSNRWEVVVSDGWYRGQLGMRRRTDGYGDTLAFLGQLESDGLTVSTDSAWTAGVGSLVAADPIAGQIEDHVRASREGQPVVVRAGGLGPLHWSPSPPVRRIEHVRPVSVTRIAPDRQVADLGQNINGWVRLTDVGPAGSHITLVHGESLDPSGDVTQTNLLDEGNDSASGPFQVDEVTSAGDVDEVFEPRHTTHGFRYVRLEDHPRRLAPDDLSGVVVHTDLRRTGWFRCSDDSLNRLHQIADWSFRGNACDIPTDCPQRERQGWTGDWQLFTPTAALLYDVMGFSLKWLRDLAAQQLSDGCVTNVVPDPMSLKQPLDDFWRSLQGSSGWGDAVVMVPWELWRAYGDTQVLSELWPAMVKWIDYAAEMARTRRHPGREAERPHAAEHEAFLWDGGFHWGEWLEPGADIVESLSREQGSVATAYLFRSAALAARIGKMLGHLEEAERMDSLAKKCLRAWRLEYVTGEGGVLPDTQANHVRALAFGLVPAEHRQRTAERLVELVREADTHLGTGFLATPLLLPVLADAGEVDLAYELLQRRSPPSWLAMVDRGATTVWELWEGVDDAGQAHMSLNHYSKGAVISFLYRYVSGIQLVDDEPAYRRFRVAPQPGGGLTWAEAAHDSPYGRIESSWRIRDDRFGLTVSVPSGTAAEVTLPGETGTRHQGPGTQVYSIPIH
jgi:alpha-L-rhamnosidase